MAQQVSFFSRFARYASVLSGKPSTFVAAVAVILIWAVTGPLFDFSNTWQLMVNTGTTIVTVLMVFLIQNTQNRDTEALQIKLDEIIRSTSRARNELLDLEEMDTAELDEIRKQYLELADHARKHLDRKMSSDEQ